MAARALARAWQVDAPPPTRRSLQPIVINFNYEDPCFDPFLMYVNCFGDFLGDFCGFI